MPSFDEGMAFLMSVKQAISKEQYTHFLSLLIAYKRNQVDMERVLNIVNQLLSSFPVLVKQFRTFLPDQVRNACRYTYVAEPFAFPAGTGIASLALPLRSHLADHVGCLFLKGKTNSYVFDLHAISYIQRSAQFAEALTTSVSVP